MKQRSYTLRKGFVLSLAVLFGGLCLVPAMPPVSRAHAATDGATVQFVVQVHSSEPTPIKSVALIVPGESNTNNIDMGDCASETRLLLVEAGKPLTCHNIVFRNLNPNFSSVELIESPGYPWKYSIGNNNTNGTIVLEKLGRPVMNFDKGSAVINIDLTPGQTNAFAPPSLSATSVTNDSITLSWTPGVFPKDSPYWYTVYSTSKDMRRVIKDGSTTARFDNLRPCTVYQAFINSSAGGSNIASVRMTGCAAPTPPPGNAAGNSSNKSSNSSSDSPAASLGSYDWGGDSYYDNSLSGSSGSDGQTDNDATPASPGRAGDTPAMPDYFTAVGTKGNSAVSLSWGASFGNSKVHYLVERSSDNDTWKVLRNDVAANAYNDFTAEFGALYYYRLTAIDSNNHYSPSVVVSYNADDFRANAGTGKSLRLTSKDKFLQLTIPSSALPAAANCSFAEATPELPLVGSEKQRVLSGPYKVVCQQKDGSLAQNFTQAVSVKAVLSDAMAKKYHNVRFEAYSTATGSWQPVAVTEQSERIIKLDSDDMAVVALAEPKGTPLWLTALIVLSASGAVVGSSLLGAKSAIRWWRGRQVESSEDDYWHKMNGV